MASVPEPRRLSDGEWALIEGPIQAFEAAWHRGERPAIDVASVAASPHPQLLLVELVHADLEFRLKAGDQARVETYLAAHPTYLARPDVILGLVRAEWALRSRAEPHLAVDHYLERFPALAPELASTSGVRRVIAAPPAIPVTKLVDQGPLPRWLGKYELRQVVGSGAFGLVYRAWDSVLNRDVAIKVPRPELAASPADLSNFLREARNAINLRHPHIVEIWDAGPIGQTVCLVGEFIEGMTLTDRLRIGSIGVAESVKLMRDILDGLDHAHRRRIIHRDLKPSNILLDRRGVPHLTDFGLAKRVSGDSTLSPAGAAQVLIGTPAYMAPEQARGDTGSVDARSDIYGAGVLLFELLTGSVPFRGRGRILQVQIEESAPPSPSALNDEVPPELEAICLKALAKHPADRYPTAEAMAADLANFAEGRPISIRPPGETTPDPRKATARLGRVTLGLALLLALAGLAARWAALERQGRRDRRLVEQFATTLLAATGLPFQGTVDPAAEHRALVDSIWDRSADWLDALAGRPGPGGPEFDLLVRAANHAAAVGFDPATRVAWERAIAAFDRGNPDPARRADHARALGVLGKLHADAGRGREAVRAFDRAATKWGEVVEARRRALALAPDDDAASLDLAESLLAEEGAACRARRDRPAGAGVALERLVVRLLVSDRLSAPELVRLAALQLDLARRRPEPGSSSVATSLGRLAARTRALDPAADFTAMLARAKVLAARADVAASGSAGDSGDRDGHDEGPIALLRAAADDFAAAMGRDPLDLDLARDRAAAEVELGVLFARRGRPAEATRSLREALRLYGAIRRARPMAHADLAGSARARAALGRIDAAGGRPLAAACRLGLAVAGVAQAVGLAPGVDAYRASRSEYLDSLRQLLTRPTGPEASPGSGPLRPRGRVGPALAGPAAVAGSGPSRPAWFHIKIWNDPQGSAVASAN